MRPNMERTPTVHSTFVATQFSSKRAGSTNWHIDTLNDDIKLCSILNIAYILVEINVFVK